jgi:hypothetical protein
MLGGIVITSQNGIVCYQNRLSIDLTAQKPKERKKKKEERLEKDLFSCEASNMNETEIQKEQPAIGAPIKFKNPTELRKAASLRSLGDIGST